MLDLLERFNAGLFSGARVADNPREIRVLRDIQKLETRLRNFRAKPGHPLFRDMPKPEIETCRKVFYALTQTIESTRVARETIEAFLARA